MASNSTIGKLIVRVLMDASGYDKEADNVTKKTASMGKLMQRTADVIGGAFVTAAKAATAAALGLAAAATAVGSSFENAIAKVAAVKGIDKTTDDFARLEAEARRLGASTLFSATQAAQGMEELARAGLSTDEIIAASQKTLELAAGSQISLADAASITAATMKQFNLSAEDTGRITDVLTATTQNSLFAMQDMAEAMKFAGVVGSGLGMSIEETSAAVAQFRDLGLEGSLAGTSFRMVMTAISRPTSQAAAALEKYGLTVADVNPETRSFRDIMVTIGEAGITTADAMTIFGQRAGAAAKSVADKMASGEASFDSLLGTLETAAGTTATTYETMTDTVLGTFVELKSAVEETLISLFSTYAQTLKELLDSVIGFVRLVAEEIGLRSASISGDMEATLGGIADFIDENAATWASQIGDIVHAAAEFGRTLTEKILPALNIILPLVDDIAIILATIWATQKAMTFATFITAVVIPAINATTFSLGGMAAALAGATGGISAMAAGISVLVVGLGVLIANLVSARNETKRLQEAQAAAAQAVTDREQGLQRALAAKLDTAQALALAEKERLVASGRLTDADHERLNAIMSLTAAEAYRMHQSGELLTDEQGILRRTSDLLRGSEDDRARVADMLEHYTEVLEEAKAAADSADLADRAIARAKIDEYTARIRGIRDATAEWRAEQSRAGDAAAREGRLLGALADGIPDASAALDGLTDAQKDANEAMDSMTGLVGQLRDELAQVGLTEEESARYALGKRREAIEAAARAALEVEGLTAEQVEQIHRDKEEALRLIARTETQRRLAETAEAERMAEEDRAAAAAAAEQQRADRVAMLREDALTRGLRESERLEQYYLTEVLPDLEAESAETRALIEADFYRQIADLRAQEEGEQLGFFDRIGSAAASTWSRMVSGVQRVGDAFRALRDLGADLLDMLERLTGFSFSLAEGMGAVSAALGEAGMDEEGNAVALSAEQAAEVAATAASEFVSGLVDEAMTFVQALVAALPEFLSGLADAIPQLIELVLTEAIPLITRTIPQVVALFVEQMPVVIEGVIAALPPLLDALLRGVTDIVAFIGGVLPDLLSDLLASLPALVERLLGALPDIITGLLDAVPKLITALLDAVPALITSILSQLPSIIVALIDGVLLAIPELVVGLIEAIPEILVAVIEAIPQIVFAIIGSIPKIIVALIGAIPRVLIAVLEAVPQIVIALAGMMPMLIGQIIMLMPQIVIALFKAFFIELPKQLPEIGKALVVAIKDAIIGALKAAGEAVSDFIGGLFSKDRDGDGTKDSKDRAPDDPSIAYGGIRYVPATMRVTVHPGEAVVPASRNPRGVTGGMDPALAGAAGLQGGGGSGGGSPVRIDLRIGERLVDQVLVEAARKGQAPGVTRMIQRTSGRQVGYDAGRFSTWNK